MGIPQYFSWLTKNHEDIIDYNIIDKKFNHLFFDFNCLIYFVYHKISRENYTKLKKNSKDEIEDFLIKEVIKYTNYIIDDIIKPNKTIMIAIDGVVPRAKMHQQRLRRYKNPKLKEWDRELKEKFGMVEEELWDTNQITPGTEFMKKFCNEIKKAIQKKQLTRIENLNILFSSCFETGEGEHKVTKKLREINPDKSETICIYGLDADLIILSLSCEMKNMYLLRESQFGFGNKDKSKFLLVNIDSLQTSIYEQVILNGIYISKESVIRDYVFLSFFFGNDFVHTIPSLSIYDGGIPFILQIYGTILNQLKQNLIIKENGTIKLNEDFLEQILINLTKCEKKNLVYLQNKKRIPKVPNDKDDYEKAKYEFDRIPLNPLFKHKYKLINYEDEDFKQKYYSLYFNLNTKKEFDEKIENICKNYLEGLLFTMNYYFDKIPAWNWYYEYQLTPFISDFYNYFKKFKLSQINFELNNPVNCYQQLMLVLPPHNNYLLPKPFRELMTDEKSLVRDLYPDEFEFEVGEHIMLYMIEPILPRIDENRLFKEMEKKERYLDEDERQYLKFEDTFYMRS
jgi:5'-3' exonuclease